MKVAVKSLRLLLSCWRLVSVPLVTVMSESEKESAASSSENTKEMRAVSPLRTVLALDVMEREAMAVSMTRRNSEEGAEGC